MADLDHIELRFEQQRPLGEWCTDGSIQIEPEHLRPEVKAGIAIGQAVGRPLEAGPNVRREALDGAVQYVAEVDGFVHVRAGKVAVHELLAIEGDVGFDTGNLDYEGDVCVHGSVGKGYTVKAAGDITVVGTVEEGCTLAARGDVTVGRGVHGRKTRIVSMGDVYVRHIEEASVYALGDITAGHHVQDGQLRAGGRVAVNKGEGSRGGLLRGGQSWARRGLDVHQAGDASGATTQLFAGVDPDQAKKLDNLHGKLMELTRQIERHLAKFNMQHVDVPQIQRLLAASTGPQRKLLAATARKLGALLKANQQLLDERATIENAMVSELDDAVIKIQEMVYPGVAVRIGDHSRRVRQAAEALSFHVANDTLVEEKRGEALRVETGGT